MQIFSCKQSLIEIRNPNNISQQKSQIAINEACKTISLTTKLIMKPESFGRSPTLYIMLPGFEFNLKSSQSIRISVTVLEICSNLW